MWAASPATNARRSRKRSTIRALIRKSLNQSGSRILTLIFPVRLIARSCNRAIVTSPAASFESSAHSTINQRRFEDFFGHALRNDNQPRLTGVTSRLVLRKLHPDSEKFPRARMHIDGAHSGETAREEFAGDTKNGEDFRKTRLQSERL